MISLKKFLFSLKVEKESFCSYGNFNSIFVLSDTNMLLDKFVFLHFSLSFLILKKSKNKNQVLKRRLI